MYCDESLKINFPMPERLKNIVDTLDECCKEENEENDYRFLNALDQLEIVSKATLLNGRITDQQLDLLWRRYGLR